MNNRIPCLHSLFFAPINQTCDLHVVSCEKANSYIHEFSNDIFTMELELREEQYKFRIKQEQKHRNQTFNIHNSFTPDYLKLRVNEEDYI